MINKRRYAIDYWKLVVERLPEPLRQEPMVAWVVWLVLPISAIYLELLRYGDAKLYALSLTPQVYSLRKMLNDRYDADLRRITIVSAVIQERKYVYLKNENKPRYVYLRGVGSPVPIYLRGEGLHAYDFVVKTNGATVNEAELLALVDGNKLAGKRYSVQG